MVANTPGDRPGDVVAQDQATDLPAGSPHGPDGNLGGDQVDVVVTGTLVLGAIIAESLAGVDSDVTMPQLRVLMLAAQEEPLNLGEVAVDLGVHPSNATRACDRLVRSGLLDRRTSTRDRRNVDLTLTVKGRRLVERVLEHRRSQVEELLSHMRPEDRNALAGSLSALTVAAAEIGHPVPHAEHVSAVTVSPGRRVGAGRTRSAHRH